MTAEHGLAGFTIEQVCDEVGVSRRTFFNYFPSKDEAVLGIDEAAERDRFEAEFLAFGPRGWSAVLDDLVELVIAHTAEMGLDREEQSTFMAAVEREPRLLARLMGLTREREHALLELIATREGVGVDDSRARAAVAVLSGVLRIGADDALRSADTDFDSSVRRALAAARTVLCTDSLREDLA